MTQKCGSSVIKQPLLLHANSAIFSFKVGQDRENKVIVADLIHIGYWRWSLQLLSSSVRLSLWTQTSKSIAYRVRSASLNSRSLLHSLGRVPLCAALPLLLTCSLNPTLQKMEMWGLIAKQARVSICMRVWKHTLLYSDVLNTSYSYMCFKLSIFYII